MVASVVDNIKGVRPAQKARSFYGSIKAVVAAIRSYLYNLEKIKFEKVEKSWKNLKKLEKLEKTWKKVKKLEKTFKKKLKNNGYHRLGKVSQIIQGQVYGTVTRINKGWGFKQVERFIQH